MNTSENKKGTNLLQLIANTQLKTDIPQFNVGDTIKVHTKIVEGTKERIQIFEGVVIKRPGKVGTSATFTVRKVSYNVGVERTFFLHSPRIAKIEVMTKGKVRRSRLFYLRPLRGKAARIKSKFEIDAKSKNNVDIAKTSKTTKKTSQNGNGEKPKTEVLQEEQSPAGAA